MPDDIESSGKLLVSNILPEYFLNAEGLLVRGMPALNIGEGYTTKNPGSIKNYFAGELAEWLTFPEEVLTFWTDERTKSSLQRCAHLPISMNPEEIGRLNPNAMTTERIQCGGECTLSGRFFNNALAPVIHSVETMSASVPGVPSDDPEYLPSRLTFGDSWIRGAAANVEGQQPDIIAKLRINGVDKVRLVGELKFCNTVKLGAMRAALLKRGKMKFCAILGQVVDYMIGHQLKYAFLSNYNETICVKLSYTRDGHQNIIPQLYFSKVISGQATVDVHKKQISLRLALFYLVHKTFSDDEDEWRIPAEVLDLTKAWVTQKPPSPRMAVTPQGKPILLSETDTDDESSESCEEDPSELLDPFIASNDGSAAARRQMAFQQRPKDGGQLSESPDALRAPYTPSKPPNRLQKLNRKSSQAQYLAALAESPRSEYWTKTLESLHSLSACLYQINITDRNFLNSINRRNCSVKSVFLLFSSFFVVLRYI